MKYIISFLVLSLFPATLFAGGLDGLDANKFRWAETYLDNYKESSGNSKEINRQRVKDYINEIQVELDNNKDDPEHAKYTDRLNRLIAGLQDDAAGGAIPKNIGDAKSNLYWAKGKIDYAIADPYYGASAENLESAEGYLKISRDILFSGKHEEATGEYKDLLDLYAKLMSDLAQIRSNAPSD